MRGVYSGTLRWQALWGLDVELSFALLFRGMVALYLAEAGCWEAGGLAVGSIPCSGALTIPATAICVALPGLAGLMLHGGF